MAFKISSNGNSTSPNSSAAHDSGQGEASHPRSADDREQIFTGLGVSAGIAVGPAYVVEVGALQVPEYELAPDGIEREIQRFATAKQKSRRQLGKLKSKAGRLPGAAAEEVSVLLDAHLAMLGRSRLTRGVEARIRDQSINAEAAVQAEINTIARQFEDIDDAYLAARIGDIREVGSRLLRNLLDRKYQAFSNVPPGSIVLAEEITPADTALMDPEIVAGFASCLGGAEGHTAIMARALGLPAAAGMPSLLREVRTGETVIVDGISGHVIARPDARTLMDYRSRRDQLEQERRALRQLSRLPATTRDGAEVMLQANVELPLEVRAANSVGAEGIGLLRTEYMIMNRNDMPSEDEQYESLRSVIEGMQGRPVTIRTLDIGGDKSSPALGDDMPMGPNPALGLRAIRLSLSRPGLLETQIAAILRASQHGPVRILLPMITSAWEVRSVRQIIDRVFRRLRRRGLKSIEAIPPVGSMIEVPAAALSADALATVSDFFAIGTNDLVQYTLAIDRGDDHVAHMFDPLHPAVIRLIRDTAAAALKARIPVSVCGEVAGDPRFSALLLGLGVRELSMTASAIPLVKRRVRQLDLVEATRRVDLILDQSDAGRIGALIDDFNEGLS